MEWIELKSQEDINHLMDRFNNFHDSCMKECFYLTGMSVDEKEKSMGQDINHSNIKLIFESQMCNPIEICFEGVKEINIHTYDNSQYFNDISDVIMFTKNNLIYWANSSEWKEDDTSKEITYIISKTAKYRNS